jgi:hypothetical protein
MFSKDPALPRTVRNRIGGGGGRGGGSLWSSHCSSLWDQPECSRRPPPQITNRPRGALFIRALAEGLHHDTGENAALPRASQCVDDKRCYILEGVNTDGIIRASGGRHHITSAVADSAMDRTFGPGGRAATARRTFSPPQDSFRCRHLSAELRPTHEAPGCPRPRARSDDLTTHTSG